jgi:hypothetical protein
MGTQLQILNDVAGNRVNLSDCSRKFTDVAQYIELTGGAVSTLTVPTIGFNVDVAGDLLAIFEFKPNDGTTFDAAVWVQPDTLTTLTLPTTSWAPTTAELNPRGFRGVKEGQEIQFLTEADNIVVWVGFYIYYPGRF